MPKTTFFNLTKAKQEALLRAAKKEFSRVSLADASIANIIKDVGIPRGSFYQYFDNKEDLFFYILNDHSKKRKLEFATILIQHDGDLFDSLYEFVSRTLEDDEDIHFIKNAFLNMTHKIEHSFSKIVNDQQANEDFKKISQLIDTRQLNISSDKDLYHLIKIVMSVTFRNIVEKFSEELSHDTVMKNYEIELNMLKKGLIRE